MKILQQALAGLMLLALAACDAGPSAVLTDGKGEAPAAQVAPRETPAPVADTPPPVVAEAPAPEIGTAEVGAVEPVKQTAIRLKPGPAEKATKTKFGDWPLWSSNRQYTAYENATYHFEKHGSEVGAKSYEEWLAIVHGFIHAPPPGVQTLSRNNGDTLFYDPNRNVFAVMTKKGAPRTLFRPYEGAAYWQKQKQIESERRTITRDSYGGSEE
ncbi:hypothetical protein [Asticcacaulis sp. YBE204]|uniref:hypothetical protein n=1 Tax=Asticcacaulis sp. YBE204 TaxID=1282363 RepID=UPI0003C3B407|nr:hypothetical protein [Asticcacaulis sp. YBE204]ESQ80856.1 hypothetical protein AEYBE204_00615 [Asticcacaulis sp. YBE204]